MVYVDNEREAYKPGYGMPQNYGAPPYYGALPYTGVSPSYAGSPPNAGTGLYGPSFGEPYGMNQPSPYTNPYADGGNAPYGPASYGKGQPSGMGGYGNAPSYVSPAYGQPGYGNVSPAFGQQGYGMGGRPGGYPGYGFGGGYGWGGGFSWIWLGLALLLAGAVLFYYFYSRGFFTW